MNRKRIEWIDVLKGLLILLICFAHIGYVPKILKNILMVTSLLRVPSFLFLSGMLFSVSKYPSFSSYFLSKFKTLFVPYILLSIFILVQDWNLYHNTLEYASGNIVCICMGKGPFKGSSLWFVNTLFLVSISYYMIYKYAKCAFIKIAYIIICSVFGYVLYLSNIHLPFKLEVVFSSILFMGLGNILKDTVSQKSEYFKKNKFHGIFTIIFLFLISFYLKGLNGESILSQNRINNYFFFYASTLFGILALVFLTTMIWNIFREAKLIKKIFEILQYIARNALPVLAGHSYYYFVISATISYLRSDISAATEFGIKIFALIFIMWLFVIPLSFNKFYFLYGKEKQSWKSLLILK